MSAADNADPGPPTPVEPITHFAAALHAEGPAHLARPRARPARVLAGVAGLGAVIAAVGVGTTALLNAPPPAPSTLKTAELITVSTPPATIPLTQEQILDLLDLAPDFGPLAEPGRRASCLSGLGYPASTQVLGAKLVDINARPAVLLILGGDSPHELMAFAVAPNCSAADTGLLASTEISRISRVTRS